MMICPRCGAENADDASSCASCGAPLAPDAMPPQASEPHELKVSRRAAIIVGCGVLMAVGVGAAYAVIPRVIDDRKKALARNRALRGIVTEDGSSDPSTWIQVTLGKSAYGSGWNWEGGIIATRVLQGSANHDSAADKDHNHYHFSAWNPASGLRLDYDDTVVKDGERIGRPSSPADDETPFLVATHGADPHAWLIVRVRTSSDASRSATYAQPLDFAAGKLGERIELPDAMPSRLGASESRVALSVNMVEGDKRPTKVIALDAGNNVSELQVIERPRMAKDFESVVPVACSCAGAYGLENEYDATKNCIRSIDDGSVLVSNAGDLKACTRIGDHTWLVEHRRLSRDAYSPPISDCQITANGGQTYTSLAEVVGRENLAEPDYRGVAFSGANGDVFIQNGALIRLCDGPSAKVIMSKAAALARDVYIWGTNILTGNVYLQEKAPNEDVILDRDGNDIGRWTQHPHKQEEDADAACFGLSGASAVMWEVYDSRSLSHDKARFGHDMHSQVSAKYLQVNEPVATIIVTRGPDPDIEGMTHDV